MKEYSLRLWEGRYVPFYGEEPILAPQSSAILKLRCREQAEAALLAHARQQEMLLQVLVSYSEPVPEEFPMDWLREERLLRACHHLRVGNPGSGFDLDLRLEALGFEIRDLSCGQSGVDLQGLYANLSYGSRVFCFRMDNAWNAGLSALLYCHLELDRLEFLRILALPKPEHISLQLWNSPLLQKLVDQVFTELTADLYALRLWLGSEQRLPA